MKTFSYFLTEIITQINGKLQINTENEINTAVSTKITLSENIWPVRIFSVNFLTHGINCLTHSDNFKILTARN